MATRPALPIHVSAAAPEIRILTPDDLPRLRLDDGFGVGEAAARRTLAAYPGRSVWIPDTLEHALLAPWRHRDEIALVQDLDAAGNAERLLASAVERCRDLGDAMLLVVEMDEVRRPRFYARAGLRLLEQVVTYELDRSPAPFAGPRRLTWERVGAFDRAATAELLRLDHDAFPWLWWNSAAEFAAYVETAGVRLFLGRERGQAVAYLGLTTYPGWGHLDRIAIHPSAQGRGFGREALAFAIDALAQAGARRVALSTQETNVRSQRLYESVGFRRSQGHDYRLYGAALRPPTNEEG